MALKQAIAEKKANDTTPRINPEVDAKLTQFIRDNPKLYDYYQEQSKEQLIRKLMLGKMQRSEYTHQRDQEIVNWVNANPDVKKQVETRIKNVPAEQHQRAFIRVAKDLATRQGMNQGQGVGV